LKIKDRLTSQRLASLSKKLKDDFGADIVLLARMLPNVCALSPEFSILAGKVEDGSTNDKMNAQSVSYTLLRFIRLVSSPKRPIMVSHCGIILSPASHISFLCYQKKLTQFIRCFLNSSFWMTSSGRMSLLLT